MSSGFVYYRGPRPLRRPRAYSESQYALKLGLTLPATILYHGHIDVTTGSAMEKGIGVRALRDGLTRHLARVRRGARLLITDRGTPIAVLAPYGKGQRGESSARLAAILASGHVNRAARPFRPDPPLVRGPGKPASKILSEDRR